MMRRPLLVKRIVGMPGDVVELRRGRLMVNDKGEADREHRNDRLCGAFARSENGRIALLTMLGLPSLFDAKRSQYGRTAVERSLGRSPFRTPLRDQRRTYAPSAMERLGTSSPSARVIRGTGTTTVPSHVPAKGDTLHITVDNLTAVRPAHCASTKDMSSARTKNALLIDGRAVERYVVEQDYYFVLGDSRHHSADSRYWGFVPEDHITGRAGFVLWGKGVSGSRSGRDMTPL